jgi:hypothetical protein
LRSAGAGAADLEHLFQIVAVGSFQIDQDCVWIEGVEPNKQTLHFANMDDSR